MNIQELIEQLQKMPATALVSVLVRDHGVFAIDKVTIDELPVQSLVYIEMTLETK